MHDRTFCSRLEGVLNENENGKVINTVKINLKSKIAHMKKRKHESKTLCISVYIL